MLGILLTAVAFALFITKRYQYSLLIFFLFITYGFLIIPQPLLVAGAPIEKTTDLALIFILAVFIYRFSLIWKVIYNEPLFRWMIGLVVFVILSAIYSYQVLNYELSGVIRVFRHYILFLSFGVLITVPLSELVKFLHTLAVITVVQCVVYLIQIPMGSVLLGSSVSRIIVNHMDYIGWVRYYNTPPYLIPTLFYYLFIYRCRTKTVHWLVVGLLAATVIAPLHRSFIITVVFVISLHILLRQSNSQRALYIALLLIAGYGASLVDAFQTRLDEGMNDVTKAFSSGKSMGKADYNSEDTFSYRMVHLFERVNYVMESPSSIIFGVGMLSEETAQAEKLPFEAGLFSERLGRVTQVETGDIVWSLVVLHLGLVGTALFLIITIKLLLLFYRNRATPLGTLGLLMLSNALLISFTGTELILIPFRALLILVAVMVIKATGSVRARDTVQLLPIDNTTWEIGDASPSLIKL